MHRPYLLIASKRPGIAAAVASFFRLFLPCGELTHHVGCLVYSCPADLFDKLDARTPEQIRDTIILFDFEAEPDPWNVRDMGGTSGLCAQLLLSYPEIYFVFLGSSQPIDALYSRAEQQEPDSLIVCQHHFISVNRLVELVPLLQLHAQGFRTIFDPTGLRSRLKNRLQEELTQLTARQVWLYRGVSEARLNQPAVSADEESGFLYLNGYAAYKFGFRVWLAQTKSEFERLLEENSDKSSTLGSPARFATALVDWDLAYRDDKGSAADTPLLQRTNVSDKVKQLIVITSFPDDFRRRFTTNADAQSDCPAAIKDAIIVSKPYGGFFDLLQARSRLNRGGKLATNNPLSISRDDIHRRFETQRARKSETESSNGSIGTSGNPATGVSRHSAPYTSAIVANRLLARARNIVRADLVDTEACVHCAILAGEAKEILGGLSKTTTYEALALQNQAEARAETSFYGTSAQVDVSKRLEDLSREADIVENAAHAPRRFWWPTRGDGASSRVNFLMQTINNLRLQFAEYEQIDAAEECLREFARLQLSQIRRRKYIRRLAAWYLDWASSAGTSVTKVFRVSGGLIVLFAAIYFLLFAIRPGVEFPPLLPQPVVYDSQWTQRLPDRALVAFWQSAMTFVELQPGEYQPRDFPIDSTEAWWWAQTFRLITWLELALAYINLGLLVSVLYRRLTKRAP